MRAPGWSVGPIQTAVLDAVGRANDGPNEATPDGEPAPTPVAAPSFVLAERARGHLPKLGWQDYAELTSLVEAFPDHRGWALAQYGLAPEDLLRVSEPFEQALRADANLAASFRVHVAARRATLVATTQQPAPRTRETVDIDAALAARAATPFCAGPVNLPASAPTPTDTTPRVRETIALTPELLASATARPVVPFAPPVTKETVTLDPSLFARPSAPAALPFRPASPEDLPQSQPAPATYHPSTAGETRELDPRVVAAAAARPVTPFAPPRSSPHVEQPPASQGASALSPHDRREVEVVAGLEASIDEDPAGQASLLRSLALNPARFDARRAHVAELRKQSSEAEAVYQAKYEQTRRDPP